MISKITKTESAQDGSSIYEPTAEDQFLRVLYRLEHGEKLIKGDWTDGKNFCVVGLLYEESKLGKWQYNHYGQVSYSTPSLTMFMHYGVRPYVKLNTLPGTLCDEIIASGYFRGQLTKYDSIELQNLSDYLVTNEHPNTNEILIEVLQKARYK